MWRKVKAVRKEGGWGAQGIREGGEGAVTNNYRWGGGGKEEEEETCQERGRTKENKKGGRQ